MSTNKITETFLFVCEYCGHSEERRATAHNKRQRFCNPSCSAKWRMSQPYIKECIYNNKERNRKLSEAAKKHMQNKIIREFHSKRIKENNPMYSEEIRNKMKNTMKQNHVLGTVVKRGGNGKGMSKCEALLKEHFPHLVWNYAQGLGKRQSGYPSHYKIDLADIERKIAIEVDGYSHKSFVRREQDRKKEEKLKEFGWMVVRFTNEQIKNDLQGVISCLQRLFQEE